MGVRCGTAAVGVRQVGQSGGIVLSVTLSAFSKRSSIFFCNCTADLGPLTVKGVVQSLHSQSVNLWQSVLLILLYR